MYRALTLQSKEVVDIILKGETYRVDVNKSNTKFFSSKDYLNCQGLAPIYVYLNSILCSDSFVYVSRILGNEAGVSAEYTGYLLELNLNHIPPIGSTWNGNTHVRVIPELKLCDVLAIYYVDTCTLDDSFRLDIVYSTPQALYTQNQLWGRSKLKYMNKRVTSMLQGKYELKRLYHVAVGKHDLVRTFIPRVPDSANPPEDTITPRICFAESLEGCLSAIGHAFYSPGKPELLTVWEYNADTRYCIPPEHLYDKGLVMDSLRTREWWVLQPITLTGKYVNLVNFETTPYRIPDESKKQEIIKYIKCNALNFDDSDAEVLQKSNIHEILYKVLGDWDRYHIDEEDVADYVGLDNCKTYCNCKFEEACNVK